MTLREAVIILSNDEETDQALRIAACRLILTSTGIDRDAHDKARAALSEIRKVMWKKEMGLDH